MALGNTWTNVASREVYRGNATVTFYIDAKLNSQDTINNYSIVDTRLTSTIVNNLAGSGYNFSVTGSNVLSGSGVWTFANETIITGQATIYHNDDGTKIATLNAYCYNQYWSINESFSGSVELPTIARASVATISPNPFNVGSTITVKTNRKSTLFTHDLTFKFGTYTNKFATGITESTTLNTSTIANTMYQQMPNDATKTGTITCETYNGSTLIGSKDSSFTARVFNSNPTFTATYQDTNATTTAITNNNQQIIRNNSTLQINIANATAKNYASLSSLKAIINGTTYNGTLSGSTGTINVGTLNLSSNTTADVVLTDSRGLSTTSSLNITILDWQLPTAIINLNRQNNFYSETDINVDADYSSLDSKNTITIKARSKKTTAGSYGTYTNLSDGVTSTLTLDNNYAWDVQVLVQDRIGSTTYNLVAGRGIPIIYFDRLKRSVGVDCFPQNNESLEILGGDILNILGIRNDTWSSDATYKIGDIVCYNRTLYKNKTGTNSGTPDTDTTRWEITSILV